MRRLFLAALAACFLVTAQADEKPAGGPAEKAPEAGAGERKAAPGGHGHRREGGPSPRSGDTRGKATQEKQKPCEVVRPCPID